MENLIWNYRKNVFGSGSEFENISADSAHFWFGLANFGYEKKETFWWDRIRIRPFLFTLGRKILKKVSVQEEFVKRFLMFCFVCLKIYFNIFNIFLFWYF